MMPKRRKKARYEARSKFERSLMDRLDQEGVFYTYEARVYSIRVPVVGALCARCEGDLITKRSRYTPDFFFRNWVIEAKGKFTPRDRKRVLALLECNPLLRGKFGILFQRDNWLTTAHKMRYTEWCRAYKIPCAVGYFKTEWMKP
jgi:hypothetical protein